jgi:dimethylhistidine N-methyltransferase
MSFAHSLQDLYDLEPTVEEFRESVRRGLSEHPKTLPCKFFYDAEGSRLFDKICELPEYYPTRTECALLADRAADIASLVGAKVRLVEFGSGAGVKIRLLLEALDRPAIYVPVDISRSHLLRAAGSLAEDFPDLLIAPVCADYTMPFVLPQLPKSASERNVGFFPGSTIGNFTPAEAIAFMGSAARLLGPGAAMIVGADLPKGRAELEAAYDDAAGVTAAFNLNLLRRINRELGANFNLDAFRHEARWNVGESRVEMHLVSKMRQTVRLGPQNVSFLEGESIHTENSYKYGIAAFAELAHAAGFEVLSAWTDRDVQFCVHVLRVL